jgi:hypothetical protein
LWADKLIREEIPEIAEVRDVDVCSLGPQHGSAGDEMDHFAK